MADQAKVSANGLSEAVQATERFGQELVDEAYRIAERVGAEEASATHVRTAANHLYAHGRSRRMQVLTAFGGVVTGSAAGTLADAATEQPVGVGLLVGSAAALAIGGMLTVLGVLGS